MKPAAIYNRAVALGLSLETDGEKLLVFGRHNDAVPPELVAELRQHKAALLDYLSGGAAYWRNRPKPDLDLHADFFATFPPTTGPAVCQTKGGTEAEWLYVLRQTLAGEFDEADSSIVESLVIGLRAVAHPLCKQAIARLRNRQQNSTTP